MLRYAKWEDWSLTITKGVQCLYQSVSYLKIFPFFHNRTPLQITIPSPTFKPTSARPSTSGQTSRRSRQAKQRASRMKRMYMESKAQVSMVVICQRTHACRRLQQWTSYCPSFVYTLTFWQQLPLVLYTFPNCGSFLNSGPYCPLLL